MKAPRLTPLRLWLMIFGLWAVFLSGLFSSIVGSPGIIQAVRLRSLLQAKQAQMAKFEAEISRVERECESLEKSRVVQEREIRRVLGYAAPDEIIFDFGGGPL